MKFKNTLQEAVLLKRNFRFLAEVALSDGKKRNLYCPNLGSLPNCDVLGSRVWFSNPNRLSQGCLDVWELTEVNGGWMVCINSEHANILVREAVAFGVIEELVEFQLLPMPIIPNIGEGIELLLKENGEQCFILIEPVLFVDDRQEAYFPEEKGNKDSALEQIRALRAHGHRTIVLYCIQHNGALGLHLAERFDPVYGKAIQAAVAEGVEILAYRTKITLEEISLESRVPVWFSEKIISN